MSPSESRIKFIERYNQYIHRDGSQNLLQWLDSSDFFTAPASTKFHGAFEGGLCLHSLRVFYESIRLVKAYSEILPDVSPESIAISSLLHDICKVNCYKTEMRNVKEGTNWTKKPFYTFKEDFCFGGHGSKSVFLILKFMPLTDEEAVAINCHMAFSDNQNSLSLSSAYRQFPLAWIVHVADEACGFIFDV